MQTLSFNHPGWWPFLLTAALPILLYSRSQRHRYICALPTFRLLQQAQAQSGPLSRRRDILLLLFRILFVISLILTFMQPVKPALISATVRGGRALVIVVDNSLSMRASSGGISCAARARGEALRLLDSLGPADRADVLFAGDAPRTAAGQLTGNLGDLSQALRDNRPGAQPCNAPAALAAAERELAQSGAASRTLAVISDFQAADWATVPLPAPGPGVQTLFLPTHAAGADSCAIVAIGLDPPHPAAGESADVTAVIENPGARRSLPVSLTVRTEQGEQLLSRMQTVDAAAGASTPVRFTVDLNRPTRYLIEVSIPVDSLPEAASRRLATDLSARQTVILLSSHGERDAQSATLYLSRAINPEPAQSGGIRVLTRRPDQVTAAEIAKCDLMVLDAPTLSPQAAGLVAAGVKAGRSLLVFLDARTAANPAATLAQAGLALPFAPQTAFSMQGQGKGSVGFGAVNVKSPLLALFADAAAGDLGAARFNQYYLTGPADPAAEMLLRFSDDTPAAARMSEGEGSLLICNFSPAPDCSDLARQPAFVSLIQELVRGLSPKAMSEAQPGTPTLAFVPPSAGEVTGRSNVGGVSVTRDSPAEVSVTAAEPGFVHLDAEGRGVGVLAVNPAPLELDLRAVDPGKLPFEKGAAPDSVSITAEDSTRTVPLWPYCLLVAVAAFIAEVLL